MEIYMIQTKSKKVFFFFRKDGARINKKTFLSMKQQGEKNKYYLLCNVHIE